MESQNSMIVIAVFALNVLHPGQYLFIRAKAPWADSEKEGSET